MGDRWKDGEDGRGGERKKERCNLLGPDSSLLVVVSLSVAE